MSPQTERPAIAYLRVSTDGQAADGVSLDAQRDKARSYCQLHGMRLLDVCEDAVSGRRVANRPGLLRALDLACDHRAVLVVYSLSRMARNTRDCIEIAERLERCGADLVSITERIDTTSSMGRFFFRMMASIGELERDQISERTRAALAYKRVQGERVGQVPYGYTLDADGVHLSPEPGQQVIVGMIHSLRRIDGYSYRQIADTLNATGIPTKQGRPWQFSTVRSVLDRDARAATS